MGPPKSPQPSPGQTNLRASGRARMPSVKAREFALSTGLALGPLACGQRDMLDVDEIDGHVIVSWAPNYDARRQLNGEIRRKHRAPTAVNEPAEPAEPAGNDGNPVLARTLGPETSPIGANAQMPKANNNSVPPSDASPSEERGMGADGAGDPYDTIDLSGEASPVAQRVGPELEAEARGAPPGGCAPGPAHGIRTWGGDSGVPAFEQNDTSPRGVGYDMSAQRHSFGRALPSQRTPAAESLARARSGEQPPSLSRSLVPPSVQAAWAASRQASEWVPTAWAASRQAAEWVPTDASRPRRPPEPPRLSHAFQSASRAAKAGQQLSKGAFAPYPPRSRLEHAHPSPLRQQCAAPPAPGPLCASQYMPLAAAAAQRGAGAFSCAYQQQCAGAMSQPTPQQPLMRDASGMGYCVPWGQRHAEYGQACAQMAPLPYGGAVSHYAPQMQYEPQSYCEYYVAPAGFGSSLVYAPPAYGSSYGASYGAYAPCGQGGPYAQPPSYSCNGQGMSGHFAEGGGQQIVVQPGEYMHPAATVQPEMLAGGASKAPCHPRAPGAQRRAQHGVINWP